MINETGNTYNCLTIIREAEKKNGRRCVICRCSCGNEKEFILASIKSGSTKSCGCSKIKHGHTAFKKESPTHISWRSMKERCKRKSHAKWYLDKGITVCERWSLFDNFIEDMGERPSGMTLERIDGNTGYSKENCKWASIRDQMNNRSNTRLMNVKGNIFPLSIFSEKLNIPLETLRRRINRGWDIHKIISTPLRKYSKPEHLVAKGLS